MQNCNSKFKIREKGQSLIELLLVIGISAIILPALITGFIASREGKAQQNQRAQAVTILNQTIEGVRSVREKGWSLFANNGTFHPAVNSGDSFWSLNPGEYTDSDGFITKVDISSINRGDCPGADCGKIVTSGGTPDPSSKKVDVTISWSLPQVSSIVETLYMTRYLDNNGHIDTTTADFTDGTTHTSTATRNPAQGDGEVILGSGGGGGNWCIPSASIVTQDLPKSGVANAITAVEGSDGNVIAFAGTGDNSSGVSFAKVDIVGDTPSISSSIPATFDGYKTNAVFGENNFAYLATDNNSKEIVIIDLNNIISGKYQEVGTINLPGNGNGDSIYIANNKAYVLGDNKFYIYNLSADRTTATLQNSGGLTLSGEGKKVLVASSSDGETYAYIATDSTSNQFQIIKVTNASSPSVVGQRTLGSSQEGVDVYVNTASSNPDRAYFVTDSSNGPEFFIINISSKSSPTLVNSTYNTSGMSPKGVTVVTGNRAIVVGEGGTYQYQVIILDETQTNLSSCAGLTYSEGINGIASVLKSSSYAYSYIITEDANAELKIILGGAGGGTFASAGNFESDTIDALVPTVFNRFDFTFVQPANTTIGLQVAVADAVGGSCSGAVYTFIGSGLTSNTSDVFTAGSPVPILSSGSYQNPGQCFKYKVYFSSEDSNKTPELRDFTVNYSP